MKFDKKLLIGAVAAALTAGVTFIGANTAIPAAIISGVVAAIAWLAAWLNGKDNTTS